MPSSTPTSRARAVEEDRIRQMGAEGGPPYRVRFADGHEAVMSPGPDCEIKHQELNHPAPER